MNALEDQSLGPRPVENIDHRQVFWEVNKNTSFLNDKSIGKSPGFGVLP